jgi:hypothetical protein
MKDKCIIHISDKYSTDDYLNDIDKYGLKNVWEYFFTILKIPEDNYGVLSIANFSELYEIGLAYVNKTNKKEQGKYYTPEDVANIMSEYFIDLKGENVCDVCCGTGNLILAYLKNLGYEKAKKLLNNGQVFLYDKDELALFICKSTIKLLYGETSANSINCINGDFLNKDITLPSNCKVISNPPYFNIKTIEDNWIKTENLMKSKEFYSSIMEKIITQSVTSVIITPYSFISGAKFKSLRKIMNLYNGFILSFDNVPGNIFNGKKHGVFNSNTSNSVRAAITVTENKNTTNGYRTSHLIRFKNTERSMLLNKDFLDAQISSVKQQTPSGEPYYKCDKELEELFTKWSNNKSKLKDIIVENSDFVLCIPNSCRYYSVASYRELQRIGKYNLCFKNKTDMLLTYTFLNSSFAYWHWRLYDGGINYPKSLLTNIPIFFDKLNKQQKNDLLLLAEEMIEKEQEYLSYKKNAGKLQENLKFDIKYLKLINNVWLETLGFNDSNIEKIHKNSINDSIEIKENTIA